MTIAEIKAANPIEREMERRGIELIGTGKERKCRCPFHSDGNPSLRVNIEKQLWKCDPCDIGGDVIELVKRLDGISAADAMKKLGGQETPAAPPRGPAPRIVKEYDYRDATGKVVYQVCRFEPKDFRQRRPDRTGWAWNLNGVERVLYRLPAVIKSPVVWIVEGEKDADTLASMGLCGTCNVGGAGKWLDSYTAALKGKDVVIIGDNDEPGQKHVAKVREAIEGKVKSVRTVELPQPSKDVSDFADNFPDKEKAGLAIMELAEAAPPAVEWQRERLEPRRFDIANPPPPAPPVYTMQGATIATAGNIVGVQAQAKAGKSALLGGMMAATMNPTGDCLGMFSANPEGLAVVHFDTEQSPADHHTCVLTTLRRAGIEQPPAWFRSYRLADVTFHERRALIRYEIERAVADRGGLHSLFLDGLADFVADPNNPEEAFAFIDELHQLAIRYAAPIIGVLHENPSSENGKTRGHLGSQLERKAETNLRLAKDGDTVTCFTERARHASVPKDRGPRFQWSTEEGMHVSVETAGESKSTVKRDALAILAVELFRDVPPAAGLSWAEAHETIEKLEGLKRTGARRRFDDMVKLGIIRKNSKCRWVLAA